MITELAKNVYWVGVTDWGLRHFHGHELSTHRGSTYNSYLILDEKVTLIDTVWTPFQNELLENIRKVIDPAKIDIIVTNHSEVDHSGALPAVLRHCPSATVVVSPKGRESVEGHYHQPWNFQVVKTGERLKIGKHELVFIEAPMLHWPDSMFTYLTGENILFPNDAFGQHYSTEFRFNDQVNEEELFEEALKYYANIITPFSAQVTRKIQEVLALNLPVDMIAPSHGVLWRKDPLQIVHKYQQWAAQVPEKRAVVLYDTMWNATRRMAEAIGDGLTARNVPNKLFHLAVSDRNDVLVEIFKAKAIIIGSPTLNRGVLPTLAPILEDIEGLSFKNKIGAAFGSFGWNAQSVAVIEKRFAASKIPVIAPGVTAKWQPRPEDLENCRQLGLKVADAVLA
jgi:anaerobic nitric oxide reductase flavorubredoxin